MIAVPVMVILLLIASNRDVMQQFVIRGGLKALGWIAYAAMFAAVVGMAVTAFFRSNREPTFPKLVRSGETNDGLAIN